MKGKATQMVSGIYIPQRVNISHEVRQFDGLSDYQAVVGGWVETVYIPTPPPTTLLVNEEGKVRGFGRNVRATALWWVLDPLARHHDVIVGDAGLVGSSRGRGTLTSLNEELIATLMSERCVVESKKAGSKS